MEDRPVGCRCRWPVWRSIALPDTDPPPPPRRPAALPLPASFPQRHHASTWRQRGGGLWSGPRKTEIWASLTWPQGQEQVEILETRRNQQRQTPETFPSPHSAHLGTGSGATRSHRGHLTTCRLAPAASPPATDPEARLSVR